MKKISTILLILTLIALPFCKKPSEKAKEYSDAIMHEMKLLSDIEEEIALKDGPELEIAIEKFKKAVPISKSKIEGLGMFEGDDALQKAALAMCIFYEEVIEGKWSQKGQDAIQNKDEELDKEMQQRQLDFAKKFGIEFKK